VFVSEQCEGVSVALLGLILAPTRISALLNGIISARFLIVVAQQPMILLGLSSLLPLSDSYGRESLILILCGLRRRIREDV